MIPLYLALFIVGAFLLSQNSIQKTAPDYAKVIYIIQNQIFLFMTIWGLFGLAYELILWIWR